MRLPRATNLAPVPELAPVDASDRRQSGERFGGGFRSPRSLEPERLPPPPEMPRRNIGAPVGIVLAIILVATIAYYFAVGGWVPSSEPAPGQQTASDPTVVAPPSWSTGQQAPWPAMAQDDNRATSAQSEISQPARSPEGEAVAMVQPGGPRSGSACEQSHPCGWCGRDQATHETRRTIHRGGRCGHGPNRIPTSCGGRRRRRCPGVGRDVRPHRACKAGCGGTGRECGESTNLVPKGREPWLNGSSTAAGHSCKSLIWAPMR